MAKDMAHIGETIVIAIVFGAMFAVGKHIHPLQFLFPDRRTILSFCAGMSVAYVFVRVMPELQGAREAFIESTAIDLPYEGMAIHLAALLGFLLYYGLAHLSQYFRRSANKEFSLQAFRLDVGGFAIYVWLMSYLLVNSLEETSYSTYLYGLAIALHFLTLDHALRHEYGAVYDSKGRFLLAGMAVLGWITGVFFAWPPYVLAPLVAFTSGGIIVNSMLGELSHDRDGRFVPFLFGGLIYGLVLLPFG